MGYSTFKMATRHINKIIFNPGNGSYSLELYIDRKKFILSNIVVGLRANQKMYYSSQALCECTKTNNGCISIAIKKLGPENNLVMNLKISTHQDNFIIKGSIINCGRNNVLLEYIYPLILFEEQGNISIDSSNLKMFVLRDFSGEENDAIIKEFLSKKKETRYKNSNRLERCVSSGMSLLHFPEENVNLILGFLKHDVHASFIEVGYRRSCARIVRLWAGLEHIKYLKPKENLSFGPLLIAINKDPFYLFDNYVREVKKAMQVRLPQRIPSGWISWYGYRLKMSQENVLENARIMAKCFVPFGANLCQLDLGWNKGDRPGDWFQANERFPMGLKELAKRLKKMKLIPGIYTSPMTVSAKSQIAKEHPELLLKDKKGKPLIWGKWFWQPKELLYSLDPTHPEVHRWLFKIYSQLKEMGFQYFKFDFSAASFFRPLPLWGERNKENLHYFDKNYTRVEAFRKIFGCIRKVIGKENHMLLWNTLLLPSIGIADSAPLAWDVGNMTSLESIDERPKRSQWLVFKKRSKTVFGKYFFNRQCWIMNPDCVVADNSGDDMYARCRMQVVALAGGHYKCSNQLPIWNKKRYEMFFKGLPPYGKAARPVDLFEKKIPEILNLPIKTSWGKWNVVGVFNWTKKNKNIVIHFNKLNLNLALRYLVYEFWEQKFLGIYKDEINIRLFSQSCNLLSIKPISNIPTLLSTDMHITQGAVEITRCVWDPKTLTFSGLAKRAPGHKGVITIYIPSKFRINGMEPLKEGGALFRYRLNFQKETVPWEIHLQENQKKNGKGIIIKQNI